MGRTRDRIAALVERRGLTTTALFVLLAVGVAAAMLAGEDEAADPAGTRSVPVVGAPEEAVPETTESPPAEEAEPLTHEQAERRVPRRFRATSEAFRRLLERNLGATVSGGRGRRVLEARCSGGRCSARYYASHKGPGRVYSDIEPIVATLVRDRSFRGLELFVHHEIFGRFKDERTPFLTVRCRSRAEVRALSRGNRQRCASEKRTGQDREAPHAKGGGPPPGKGPPEGRGAKGPDG